MSVDACRGECARGEEEKAPQGVWVWVGGVSRSREWQWAGLGLRFAQFLRPALSACLLRVARGF